MQDAGVAANGAAGRASCRTYMPQGSRVSVTPASDGVLRPASKILTLGFGPGGINTTLKRTQKKLFCFGMLTSIHEVVEFLRNVKMWTPVIKRTTWGAGTGTQFSWLEWTGHIAVDAVRHTCADRLPLLTSVP
jgi:hypothetical protein